MIDDGRLHTEKVGQFRGGGTSQYRGRMKTFLFCQLLPSVLGVPAFFRLLYTVRLRAISPGKSFTIPRNLHLLKRLFIDDVDKLIFNQREVVIVLHREIGRLRDLNPPPFIYGQSH